MTDIYCVKCKSHTANKDEYESVTKNNRPILKAKCAACGSKKNKFLKINKSGGDLVSFADSALKKVGFKGLPKLHLPGHNWTGPGTPLEIQLNPATDEPWPKYKPINKVDETALHHDKCYRDADTGLGTRHICDKIMLSELNDIKNPTIRERIERGLVKSVIGTKYKLGLGCPHTLKKTKYKKLKNYTHPLKGNLKEEK